MITKLTGALITIGLISLAAGLSNWLPMPYTFMPWVIIIPLWAYAAIELERIDQAWNSDVRS